MKSHVLALAACLTVVVGVGCYTERQKAQLRSVADLSDSLTECREPSIPIEKCHAELVAHRTQCDASRAAPPSDMGTADPCILADGLSQAYAARLCREKSVQECVAACDNGDTGFACYLASQYAAGGLRMPRDPAAAKAYLAKGCALKDKQSCDTLANTQRPSCDTGTCYDGDHNPITPKAAVALLEKGCADGQMRDCEDVVRLMDAKVYVGIPAERAAALRRLCNDKNGRYTRYCGLLKDMGQ